METSRDQFIKPEQFMNKVLKRNGEVGWAACEIMAAAIDAVNPYQIIRKYVNYSKDTLAFGDEVIDLHEINRIVLLGFGKASAPMAKAMLDILGEHIDTAEIVTKSEEFLKDQSYWGRLKVHLGGHPIPNEATIESTRSILKDIGELSPNDLVLVVISGGGSALFSDPLPGIALADLQEMTSVLLRCGADISEINTLRKHLDRVKGGRLALRFSPAKVRTFILSDVIGDRLDMIASGPTIQDPTTFTDAAEVIRKYQLKDSLPESIVTALERGQAGAIEETLKSGDFNTLDVANHLVGTNIMAACAAKTKAEALGYNAIILTSHLTGHTPDVARTLASIIQTEQDYEHPLSKPACLLLGGETTVAVTGNGKGGRNQDLVLHMVRELVDQPGVLFVSLATDGEDGPTDAAGAASDAKVYHEGSGMWELCIDTYISDNNSYQYFEKVGGLIKIGSTGTNVNDLILVFVV